MSVCCWLLLADCTVYIVTHMAHRSMSFNIDWSVRERIGLLLEHHFK